MNIKEIGAVREKKKEHTLMITVEFEEEITEAEAVERVLQKLDEKKIIKDEEPKKKEEKRKSPTKIDWDKACALKLAGWKNADIATELHANKGTIDNAIYKHLDEYRKGKREGRCEEVKEEEEF